MTDGAGLKRLIARADVLLDRALYYGSALLLITIASAVMYTVVMRYVFNSAPLWAEQAPRVFFLWMSYLAVAVATRRGQNIRVTFFVERLPPFPRLVLDLFMHVLVLAMLATLFWFVWPIIELNLPGIMLSTGWSYAVTFFPLPIGAALMLIYQVRLMARSIEEYREARHGGPPSALDKSVGGD